MEPRRVDLVLSSGFLAFARHAGFLRAVEEASLGVDALTGTSSGSVVAALWAAGMPASNIAQLFAHTSLLRFTRMGAPWRGGVLSLGGFRALLASHLPATFEGLTRPLAVGVVDTKGAHLLLKDGPLLDAVVASCAMPGIFERVEIAGARYADGGAADRLGLGAHRSWRPNTHVLAHWVERTAGKDVEANLSGVTVVKTPRSGATFWNLGDVSGQTQEAHSLARAALAQAGFSLPPTPP